MYMNTEHRYVATTSKLESPILPLYGRMVNTFWYMTRFTCTHGTTYLPIYLEAQCVKMGAMRRSYLLRKFRCMRTSSAIGDSPAHFTYSFTYIHVTNTPRSIILFFITIRRRAVTITIISTIEIRQCVLPCYKIGVKEQKIARTIQCKQCRKQVR